MLLNIACPKIAYYYYKLYINITNIQNVVVTPSRNPCLAHKHDAINWHK